MKIIKPSVEIINPIDYKTMLNTTELAIRNCYDSYNKMKEGSAEGLIRGCIKSGHDAVLEFGDICVKLVTDRAVMSQITRHRIGVCFCIRSQRYVNYAKGDMNIEFIEPKGLTNDAYDNWKGVCKVAEAAYLVMVNDCGMKPETARSVLPNCTATTIYMKANIREWRHILSLRTGAAAQTEIRELMLDALAQFYKLYPIFFEDIYNECIGMW